MPRWWRRKRAARRKLATADREQLAGASQGGEGQSQGGEAPKPDPVEPASARASEEAAEPSTEAESPPAPTGDAEPESGAAVASSQVGASSLTEEGLASVADQVQAVLQAAEEAAAAIRREAEADAGRMADERRRQLQARDELQHLSRLADALAVQAEAVKRQCGVLYGLIPAPTAAPDAPAPPGPGTEAPAPADESGEPPSDPAEPRPGGPREGAEPREPAPEPPNPMSASSEPSVAEQRSSAPPRPDAQGAPHTLDDGEPREPMTLERVEAYRMRLAGARREEVETYLERAGVGEAGRIAGEVFDDLDGSPPERP